MTSFAIVFVWALVDVEEQIQQNPVSEHKPGCILQSGIIVWYQLSSALSVVTAA